MNASVRIEVGYKNQRSFLKECFCTQPFKVADVTENKKENQLHLVLMSSSPGILDGDHYAVDIKVGKKSYLKLTTQSYQRLFQMKRGATQTMNVVVDETAIFSFLPHPVVPHAHSSFSSKNKLHLQQDSTVLWAETLACGRKENNEVFHYTSYHNNTDIFIDGRLVIRENIIMKPAENNLKAIGQLEGYTHQSVLIFISKEVATDEIIKNVIRFLDPKFDIEYGVTTLQVPGIMVRMHGNKAEQLHSFVQTIGSICLQSIINETIVVG
jgi:urease accessory protein